MGHPAAGHDVVLLPDAHVADVIHHALQLAVHRGVGRVGGVAGQGVRVEAVRRLVGRRVQLRVEEAGGQHRVQRPIASGGGGRCTSMSAAHTHAHPYAHSCPTAIGGGRGMLGLVHDAREILIGAQHGGIADASDRGASDRRCRCRCGCSAAGVRRPAIGRRCAAQIGRVGGQQVLLHRRLRLRAVAQAARSVLAGVDIVFVARIGVISRYEYGVSSSAAAATAAGAISASAAGSSSASARAARPVDRRGDGGLARGAQQAVVRHLAAGGADQAAQVLIQIAGRRVGEH